MISPLRGLFFALLLALPTEALAGLKVVTTVPDLAAVAQAVGGEHVSVTAMALPTPVSYTHLTLPTTPYV